MDGAFPGNGFPMSSHLHFAGHFDQFLLLATGSTVGPTLPGPLAHISNNTAEYIDISPSDDPLPNYAAVQSQEFRVSSVFIDTSSVQQQSMPSTPFSQKRRKARTLRAEDWVPVKARIVELHIDQNMHLQDVKDTIEQEFAFEATVRQYRSAISKWGLDKNIKNDVMQSIVRKRQYRKLVEPEKRNLNFKVRSFVVSSERVEAYMKRNNIAGDTEYAPSPAASTPSELLAWTPSESAFSPSNGVSPLQTPRAMAIESPDDAHMCAVDSPAPSVPSILQSHDEELTGQSPAARPTNDDNTTPISAYLSGDVEQPSSEAPDALDTELRLGSVLFQRGRYRSAERVLRSSVARCENLYGKSHEGTLRALTRLGQVVCRQGLFSEAEKIFQECIETQKLLLGPKHPDTLVSMSEFAGVLINQGHYAKAEAIQRQALNHFREIRGTEHPSTLISMRIIARALACQGRYSEAEEMNRQVLKLSNKVLGPEHPDTLISMFAVAEMIASCGNYSKAEALHQTKLDLSTKVLGPEHPDTLASIHAVAKAVAAQGRYDEAEAMHRRGLELSTKVLGPEHPNTLVDRFAVAEAVASQGHYSRAEALHREKLTLSDKVLGPEHPHTIASIYAIANTLACQGQFSEAEAMRRRVLELRIKVLGADHPETIASRMSFVGPRSGEGGTMVDWLTPGEIGVIDGLAL